MFWSEKRCTITFVVRCILQNLECKINLLVAVRKFFQTKELSVLRIRLCNVYAVCTAHTLLGNRLLYTKDTSVETSNAVEIFLIFT